MKTKEILVSGIAGTSFMTLFSYLVSLADGENFSEPERLGQLVGRLIPKLDEKQSQALGWLGHYGVGLLFSLVYVELWREGKIKPDWKTNLCLGGISGLIAVAIWKSTFKMHPLPPKLNFDKYYLQLVPAHVIFALFARIGYQLIRKK
ncbi:hypothetical protein [Mucilaginibacter ginsenosidivorax]|uniref:DUF2938 domain-containing protein n=1 Tax=Mucilaginibacter ginsenosidivorax TaxID=862126 RepID=A0A5B8VWY3_9SPHI|nr:hypothetical protein [Mucilaginibacter ginsenosidivorax]QEC74748.1 hypothetical protein FSB76_01840 [Mucilaginibacter ginsenosidivorax]